MPGTSHTRWCILFALIPLHFFSPSNSQAQGIVSADSSHFPLDERNVWRYIVVLDPPGEPFDTLGPYELSPESIVVSDTVYFVGAYPFPLADTIRTGDDGNIYARIRGKDMLLFDFALEASETYQVDLRDPEPYVVTATYDDVVQVSTGTFEQTITLHFDMQNVMDAGHSYTFARGTGIIQAYDGGGDYRELHDAELYPVPDTLDWHGYVPLAVGNRWQYRFVTTHDPFGVTAEWLEDWRVTGDTLIGDTSYYVVDVRCSVVSSTGLDGPPPCVPNVIEHRFLRYDEEAANVVELRDDESAEERFLANGYDFRLDAPFLSTSDGNFGEYEYGFPNDEMSIGKDKVEAVTKTVAIASAVPGNAMFAHGAGLLSMEFHEGGGTTQTLTYAFVDGHTYGAMQPVSAENPEIPVATFSVETYPNPASGSVQVAYRLAEAGEVVIEVLDGVGRRVRRIDLGMQSAGAHRAELDLRALASGQYILSLETGGTPRAHAPLIVLH